MEDKILHLSIKEPYFSEIKNGTKKLEYRQYKEYWTKRLQNPDGSFKQFCFIQFRNGYSKNAPMLKAQFLGTTIIKQRISLFKREKLYQISLGEILITQPEEIVENSVK